MSDRFDRDLERLWQEFHGVVNMTSEELRTWLLTHSSGEEGFGADPDLNLPGLGRGVLHVLGKRKVDLTDDDLDVMRRVIRYVRDHQAEPRSVEDAEWRHAMMTVGHDPLQPATRQA
ncbi:DUF3140 domain-containing protein [Sphaerimonospora thailandensis]|uniref:DUF3140 domain-containing protein n=1 Tax=Sphaerimonospora thailandensis TaxID=795644 RepID=A0A8J3R8B3_9ACTN|nr:DUF3140 domain-containing protein [Sphaerimonospora thailandensis]GIH67873.1 hypothetical protein Mth01_01260 [Sphaerimonospora thailandensis]